MTKTKLAVILTKLSNLDSNNTIIDPINRNFDPINRNLFILAPIGPILYLEKMTLLSG